MFRIWCAVSLLVQLAIIPAIFGQTTFEKLASLNYQRPEGVDDPSFPTEAIVFEDREADDALYLAEVNKWTNPIRTDDLEIYSGYCMSHRPPNRRPPNVAAVENIYFKGEFGFELLVVLPYAYYHFLHDTLNSTTSCGDESTALLYWFSPRHKFDPTCSRDAYGNDISQFGWTLGLHKSPIPEQWFPPPLASHFREWGKVWYGVPRGGQLVVISNKLSIEWQRRPINLFDLQFLRKMIDIFINAGFYIVYNRPGNAIPQDDWESVGDRPMQFDDYKIVRKLYSKAPYKGRLILMQDIQHLNPGLSFNEVQIRVMARSKCFVSVQGGNSILSSYFGGVNLVYARAGFEVDYDAYHKYYGRLSGARVFVARNYSRMAGMVQHLTKIKKKKKCIAI